MLYKVALAQILISFYNNFMTGKCSIIQHNNTGPRETKFNEMEIDAMNCYTCLCYNIETCAKNVSKCESDESKMKMAMIRRKLLDYVDECYKC